MKTTRNIRIMAYVAVIVSLTSCYKLFSARAPKSVEAGTTFEVSFTVVDDGSDTQNFVTDWSYAGIRVPEGWTVTMPKGAHRQYAENWVYYSDGSKVNSSHDMKECARLTSFYEEAAHRDGYRWHAFQSSRKVPKNISACWRNGCDSISVTFLVTVPEGTAPGKYSIDFIGGDEEDAAGVDKYATCAEARDSRLFHVGTVGGNVVKASNTSLSRIVEIVEQGGSAIRTAAADKSEDVKYTVDGKRIPAAGAACGIYIVKGKKTLTR